MEGSLAARVRDSIYDPDPIDAAERTKDVVAQALREADPSSVVSKTSHFNNSFMPDLVIEWPDQSQEVRSVFLRPTRDFGWLREDVESTGGALSTFISLDNLLLDSDRSSEDRENLEVASRRNGSFVTEVASIEVLADASRQPGTGASLLAAAVVRGGLGVLDPAGADDFEQQINRAFEGARITELEPTSAGVDALNSHLGGVQAAKLGGVMQAIWTASGGSPSAFPSNQAQISTTFDSDSLAFLLRFGDTDDEDFWARVARGADLESIVAAAASDRTWSGLQNLMKHSVRRLTAKVCAVRQDKEHGDAKLRWQVSDGMLVLTGLGISSSIASTSARVTIPNLNNDGLDIAELLVRARRASIAVSEFKASNGDVSVSYGSNSQSDITDDEEAASLGQALDGRVLVTNATANILDSHRVDVSFVTGRAAGRSNAQVSLAELVWSSINLLANTRPADRRQLAEALRRDV